MSSSAPEDVATDLLERVEARRAAMSGRPNAERRRLGQFFTPSEVAQRIALHAHVDHIERLSILDPGAGIGVLSAALVARLIRERSSLSLHLTAVEVDPSLHGPLMRTLADCQDAAAACGVSFDYSIVISDFIEWGTNQTRSTLDSSGESPEFDIIIQNPPYGKVQRASSVRRHLEPLGVEVPNIYAAFLAVSSHLLAPNGQIIAITPRSFCNGSYFRVFRKHFFRRISLDRITVFHERDTLFADSMVLQETIIFSGTRGHRSDKVAITTSRNYVDQGHERLVPYADVISSDDPEMFLRIPTDDDDDVVRTLMDSLSFGLDDLGLQVSTGRVVDFRSLDFLRPHPEPGTVPLIYPHHFYDGAILWPVRHAKKPNAIVSSKASEKLLFPKGVYVLVKRLSSKEEPRRVVSAIYDSQNFPGDFVGFENHLNVLHQDGGGLESDLAVGLSAWLNSSLLDSFFRQFSGHTQVNATDLRNMRYPDRFSLTSLGRDVMQHQSLDQAELDALVEFHVRDSEIFGEAAALVDVSETRRLLTALRFDSERCNERSALVLLALAQLGPDNNWCEAENPLMRTVKIMDFLRQRHGRDYKPNTRETIRRQTLHQFADAGLIVQNPDDPSRPVNSPKWCYQLTNNATELIRKFGSADFDEALEEYHAELPGLMELYFAERESLGIPAMLPGGKKITFSPGGQNLLLADMVEKFCPHFTPGGKILYAGDAKEKWRHFEKKALAELGLIFDDHGKMPDLIVHYTDRDWLVLMEAASSHGPIDGKRHKELKELFAESKIGLVFVSCFPTRAEMRKHLKVISWETEVWCAESPTHMIHFNGERFLGPYEENAIME